MHKHRLQNKKCEWALLLLWVIEVSEFLKAAIIQSHNCAKYLRICAKHDTNFNYLSQFDKVLLVSHVLMSFFTHVSAQTFQWKHFDCANDYSFRKSEECMINYQSKNTKISNVPCDFSIKYLSNVWITQCPSPQLTSARATSLRFWSLTPLGSHYSSKS